MAPLLLCALVLVALLGRVWGSFIGLPHAYLPDEELKLRDAKQLALIGSPHDQTQPDFLPLSLFVVHAATRPLEPSLRSAQLPGGHALNDRTGFAVRLWIARLWLDVLSTATVPIVYLIARRSAGVGAGLIAAALLALNPVAIAAANYVKEDTPLALWLAVASLASIELGRRRTPALALAAGASAGLAVGSKYVGVIALFLLLPGLLGTSGMSGTETPARARTGGAGALGAIALAGFLVALAATTPAIVLEPAAVFRGGWFQLHYALGGHHDGISLPIGDTMGLHYFRTAILPTLGAPALVATLGGLAFLLRVDRRALLVLATSSLGLLLVLEVMPAKPYPFSARYALPAIPALCALAGVGSARCARLLTRGRGSFRGVLGMIATVVVAWPLSQTIRFATSMYPDTREEASSWLTEHVEPGTWVLSTPYSPLLPPGRFRRWPLTDEPSARRILESQPAAKVVVLSDLFTTRFIENPEDAPGRVAFLDWLDAHSTELATFARQGPRFGFYNPVIVVRSWTGRTIQAQDGTLSVPEPNAMP